MKVWQIGEQNGIGGLKLAERAEPKPPPGWALVAIKASSLNRRDIMMVDGKYGAARPQTRIPLSDGAGEVIALGEGAAGIGVGDRVTATHFTDWRDGTFDPAYFAVDLGSTIDGTLGERVLIPAHCLLKIPDALTFEEAASLPVAAVTAWSAIHAFAGVKSGDSVLALGTGGVSIFALQIAKMNGARVIITSSQDDKLAACRKLGADVTINYKSRPDWEKAVLEATSGRGVDIVVETGGQGTMAQSLAACAPNARVALIGALAGRPDQTPALAPVIGKNLTLKGITSGSRRMFSDLLKALVATGTRPVIDKVFPFADAPQAYQYMVDADFLGKIVIRH